MRQAHRIIDGKKICGECGLNKSVDEFSKHGLTSAGNQRYAAICNDCRWPNRKQPYLDSLIKTPKVYDPKMHLCICGRGTTSNGSCWQCKYDREHPVGSIRETVCNHCNRPIFNKIHRGRPRTCCDSCKRCQKQADKKAHRYAKRITIMNRDNWICHLCGEEIPDLPIDDMYNPLFGEADHFIPHSLCGVNLLRNLRASHRICNEAKGNRIVDSGRFMLMNCPECGYWVNDPTIMASGCKCGRQVISGTPPAYCLDSEPIPQDLIDAMINAFAKKRKRYVSKFIVS